MKAFSDMQVITFGAQDCPDPDTQHIKITTAAFAYEKGFLRRDTVKWLILMKMRWQTTRPGDPVWSPPHDNYTYPIYVDAHGEQMTEVVDKKYASRKFNGLHLDQPISKSDGIRDTQYSVMVKCDNWQHNCNVKVRIEWECTSEAGPSPSNVSRTAQRSVHSGILVLGLLAAIAAAL